MHTVFVIIFWSSFASLCFSYFGYPLLVLLASRLNPKKRQRQVDPADEDLPQVTVLIAAHNAEHHIGERIANILACDYPQDRLNIVVASDGSTDATVQVVKRFDQAHIEAIAFPQRRGKSMTLVDAVRQLHSEVLVFTDASSRFDRDSVRQLARHFVDPQVGIVAGKVAIVDEQGVPSESLYWRTEMMVRQSEAQLGIMLGASGAIYAIRRRLFVEPARSVINDDLVFPLLSHLRHGGEFIFDETAKAYALSTGGLAGEFRRRCRIGAGAYQCLPVLRELLQWPHAKQAVAFCSHKLLRWICPFLLVALIATNLALLSFPGYRLFFSMQVAAYLLAVFGLIAPGRGHVARVARIAAAFLVMNIALLMGFFRWVFNPRNVVWVPTGRSVKQLRPFYESCSKRVSAEQRVTD